jgi:hypothetical protein
MSDVVRIWRHPVGRPENRVAEKVGDNCPLAHEVPE